MNQFYTLAVKNDHSLFLPDVHFELFTSWLFQIRPIKIILPTCIKWLIREISWRSWFQTLQVAFKMMPNELPSRNLSHQFQSFPCSEWTSSNTYDDAFQVNQHDVPCKISEFSVNSCLFIWSYNTSRSIDFFFFINFENKSFRQKFHACFIECPISSKFSDIKI